MSRQAIGAFVSGLLTVLCSCVGQMLELTNREVFLGGVIVVSCMAIVRRTIDRRVSSGGGARGGRGVACCEGGGIKGGQGMEERR